MIKELKVAIFGGSFNPPHLAHQLIAKKVVEELDIDLLIILPAYQNPLKNRSSASPQQRLQWCKDVFSDKKIEVSSYEIDNKILYTYQSLEYFNKIYDTKYLIIGADNLKDLAKWRNFEWINDTITWIVFTRDEICLDTSLLKRYKVIKIDMPISSTKIRENGDLIYIDEKIKQSVKTQLEGK
ncbi:MAG: nicotinate (nicotinamide) nucleotide adenylyltransferase [Epsilonproteobacteria bacterium]|nr:nicotinate (nicotinamide) nucleotide adenylyltransferase [Campylobacterota bacterium]